VSEGSTEDRTGASTYGLVARGAVRKPITPETVVAYTQCPRKAFLLLCTDEQGTPHDYPRILAQQQHANETKYVNGLEQGLPEATPYDGRLPAVDPRVLLQPTLRAQELEAHCAALTPAGRGASARGRAYELTLVVGTHTITKEQRLELLFAGYVLGQMQRAVPAFGTIVDMDGQAHKVPLAKQYALLDPILATVRAWTAVVPSDPPPVVLNKYCPQCPFRIECVAEAERNDDLSLLERITPKARQRYHARGIFTVRQLSYLFRPRRKRKRTRGAPVQHHPELQALALREGKTYLHEPPALTRHPVELFLDIEGVPDRHAYYLLGLLVCHDGTATYHGLWADAVEHELGIWRQLLVLLDQYPDAPVYHYGRYEPRAITTLARWYQTDCTRLTERLVNLNDFIYGKVYFPIRSNRLKDIGRFLGFSWSEPEASGLQSLVWRHRWEATRDEADKQRLLTYNEEDCKALRALADELTRLRDAADTEPTVDFAARPKRHATDTGEVIHRQFGAILRSAHAGYEHAKISLEQAREVPTEKKRRGARPGHPGYHRIVPKARKVVYVPPRETCPRCNDRPLRQTDRLTDNTIVDLVFTDGGCRKTVTKYIGPYGICPQCGQQYAPSYMSLFGPRVFGHGLQAWVIYQRLVLHLPYPAIAEVLDEQFGVRISEGGIIQFLRIFARNYAETEASCQQRLLLSPFIHVDETKISIQGVDQYVWVFTDGKHVIFRLTATRETTVVQEVLAGYNGILITDFYAGYDAVPCPQQRCLVHLIRDLNEDLWRAPFDAELEPFVLKVRDLLVPILEAVNRHGLKKRHLSRFIKTVNRFYAEVISGRIYRSEVAQTYQKRFKRYRGSLFTFLEYDGIPWNNNMAERAIRHLAVQRKISGHFSASVAPQYLLLLGLAQTCRFQDKSLLKFLLSGEKDIDVFKATKRARRPVAVGASGGSGHGYM
jgi:predicted RecB family nuclease